MKINREEDTCFNLKFAYVFISHSVNNEMSIHGIQKNG